MTHIWGVNILLKTKTIQAPLQELSNILKIRFTVREKGRYLTQPYDKSPYTHRKKPKKQRDNTQTPP